MLYLQAMRRYASFGGRASQKEFWEFMGACFLFALVAVGIDSERTDEYGQRSHLFAALVVLVHLLPGLAVFARRCHDTERTGWWALASLVPVLGLLSFVIGFVPGTRGANRYGVDPLNPVSPPATAVTARIPTTPQRDPIAEIERLAQLKASGSLSEAEFEVMKAQALREGQA